MQKSPFLVGICGGSGSGKSYLVQQLRNQLPAHQLCIVSMDDFYQPIIDQAKDDNGIANFDLPTAIDKPALLQTIQSLLKGKSVTLPKYTYNNPNTAPTFITLEPAPILLIEGVFTLYFEEIRNGLNLAIFVEADDVHKVIRRIKRDGMERGYDIKDVIYRYENHVLPSYKQHIEPYKNIADMIINNHRHMDNCIPMLVSYFKNIGTN